METGGGVRFCRVTQQEAGGRKVLLTVVMKDDRWLQATIDPDQTLRIEDVTTGKTFTPLFGAQGRELRRQGRPCTVSPADGSVSLG